MIEALRLSLAGFNGSPNCDRSSPEAFFNSWRARMKKKRRDDLVTVAEKDYQAVEHLIQQFLGVKKENGKPRFTKFGQSPSEIWKVKWNPATKSYIFVPR